MSAHSTYVLRAHAFSLQHGLSVNQEAALVSLLRDLTSEQRDACHDAINGLSGAMCDLHGSVETRCVPAASAAHAALHAEL